MKAKRGIWEDKMDARKREGIWFEFEANIKS